MAEKLLSAGKTWADGGVNQHFEHDGTSYDATDARASRKNVLLAFKTGITTLGSAPWTVKSSNSETQGLSSSGDVWDTHLDLRWRTAAGSTHSWIVFESIAIGCQLCIACLTNVSGGPKLDVFIAPIDEPFTGGTTTARPTSPREFSLCLHTSGSGFGYWGVGNTGGSGEDYMVHVLQSDDGECTHFIIQRANVITGWWRISKHVDFPTGWTRPFSGKVRQTDPSPAVDGAMRGEFYIDTSNENMFSNGAPPTLFQGLFGPQTFRDVNNTIALHAGHATNPFSGRNSFDPVLMFNVVTVTNQYWGRIPDLWFCPRGAHQTGGSVGYPGNGYSGQLIRGDDGKRYARFGDFLVIWPSPDPLRWQLFDVPL